MKSTFPILLFLIAFILHNAISLSHAQYLIYMPVNVTTETWSSGASRSSVKSTSIYMLNLEEGVGCGWSINGKKFSAGGNQSKLDYTGTATTSHVIMLFIANESDYSFLDGDLKNFVTQTLPNTVSSSVPAWVRLTAFDWEDGFRVKRYSGTGSLKLEATQYINNGSPQNIEEAKARFESWLLLKGYKRN
jgi:hypothetical protein